MIMKHILDIRRFDLWFHINKRQEMSLDASIKKKEMQKIDFKIQLNCEINCVTVCVSVCVQFDLNGC